MNPTLALTTGGLIAVMVMINGVLSQHLGTYLSCAVIHGVGLAIITGVLLTQRQKRMEFSRHPWYLYTAGAIGILTVLFTNWGFIGLGASLTVALGLLGQSLVSVIIDHYGLFEMPVVHFSPRKYFGLALIFSGIAVMLLF